MIQNARKLLGKIITSSGVGSDYRGSVDVVDSGRVAGWVMNNAKPSVRPSVVVRVNGLPAASGECSNFRTDLLNAGIGDGHYGFEIPVTDIRLKPNDVVSILVDDVHEIRYAGKPADQSQNSLPVAGGNSSVPHAVTLQKPVVWFDLTDLFSYFQHHINVSGIQRVQAGYVYNMLISDSYDLKYVRFVIQDYDSRSYVELLPFNLKAIIESCASGAYTDLVPWREFVRNVITQSSRNQVKFKKGDILCLIGASWIISHYYSVLSEVKRDFGVKYIQLIYDVIPSLSPEFCNGVLVDAFNDAAVKAFHYADALLTISEAAKLDIIKLADTFGQKCPPVSVVPLGSTIDYFAEAHDGADGVAGTNSGGNPPSPAVARICAKPFVLSVGTVEVRKNHTYLFRIWKMLMEKHEDATPNLVFVGRRGWLVEDLFQQLEQTHYLNGKIIVLSDINDDDLNTLYRESSFTVFPSLYEGWGLPVGESLAHGKLCVASSTSSVPEVGGEFAIYVDPHNLREGYTRIESLILNPDEIRIREKKISEEYKPLTWGKATEGFMALISGISKDLESADQGVTTPTTGGLPVLTSGRHYRVGKVGGKGRRSGNRLAATAASTLETIVSSEALTSTNWYDVEDWGCWSKGAASRIAFAPDSNPDSGFAIFLEVILPPGTEASRCSVSLNGKHQGDWELSKDGKRGVIILETDLKQTRKEKSRQPEIVVDFDLGRDGGMVAGGRTLGLGLVSIFICRTDDLLSRVRYFEASQSNVVRL